MTKLLLSVLVLSQFLHPQPEATQHPSLISGVMRALPLLPVDALCAGQPLAVTVSGPGRAAGRLTTGLRKLLARTRTAVAELLGRTPVEDPLRDRVLANLADGQRTIGGSGLALSRSFSR